jgi:hypothetical protein
MSEVKASRLALSGESDRNEQLANALASLANNLRYKELLALTQPRHA